MLSYLAVVILVIFVVLALVEVIPWVPHVILALCVVVLLFLVDAFSTGYHGPFRRKG